MIEHADLFDQPQRRIERQEINERAETQALGHARQRAQKDARNRHHVERCRVVLGDVHAIEAGLVGGGDLLVALELGDLTDQPAHGAGGASQQALGTSVMGGMIAVVILALLMVPVFFVSVQRVLAGDREKVEKKAGAPSKAHAPAE